MPGNGIFWRFCDRYVCGKSCRIISKNISEISSNVQQFRNALLKFLIFFFNIFFILAVYKYSIFQKILEIFVRFFFGISFSRFFFKIAAFLRFCVTAIFCDQNFVKLSKFSRFFWLGGFCHFRLSYCLKKSILSILFSRIWFCVKIRCHG